MPLTFGIRREDKNEWERRVPLTPAHAAALIERHGVRLLVQPAPRRVFSEEAYREVGAEITEDLREAQVILGVKEIPLDRIQAGAAHLIFSHTIKGQPYNMRLLKRFLDQGCHLIDYERITDSEGRRLVFFGRHAGLAGMVETLHALGQRLAAEGLAEAHNPFAAIRQPYRYRDLDEAEDHLRAVGARIAAEGLAPALCPLVIGILGYGNVARGVSEILACLPVREITPQQLLAGGPELNDPRHLFRVVFREADTVIPRDPSRSFDLSDYFRNPQDYRANFARFLPHLTLLVNAIYWEPRCPVLVTRDDLQRLFATDRPPRLKVIGDISCDIEGSIAITVKGTLPDRPCFVYDLKEGRVEDGYAHPSGPVVMAVDNLPTEFPKEASQAFGDALAPLLPALAHADFSRPLAASGLPAEFQRATIVYQGRLTEAYRYLQAALTAHGC